MRENQNEIQNITDKMTPAQKAKHLLDWPLSENGNVIDFPFAQSSDYPEIAAAIKGFFSPSGTPSSSSNPTTSGTPSLNGVTIQVRSSEDDEKDLSAKVGQSKSKLYLIGGNWDMAAGTISNVSYPALSNSLKTVHNKPRSARTDLMQSMLQMGCDKAKEGSASSIYSKLASIHVVQKSMAANILHGNLQIARVGNLYAEASLHDSTAYLPQLDMAKIERIRKEEQSRTNEKVMNLSDSK